MRILSYALAFAIFASAPAAFGAGGEDETGNGYSGGSSEYQTAAMLVKTGQYDKALEHAKIAHDRAPNKLNKDALAQAIETLKKGEDIN